LRAQDALPVGLVNYFGERLWQLLGLVPAWDRHQWPIPAFAARHPKLAPDHEEPAARYGLIAGRCGTNAIVGWPASGQHAPVGTTVLRRIQRTAVSAMSPSWSRPPRRAGRPAQDGGPCPGLAAAPGAGLAMLMDSVSELSREPPIVPDQVDERLGRPPRFRKCLRYRVVAATDHHSVTPAASAELPPNHAMRRAAGGTVPIPPAVGPLGASQTLPCRRRPRRNDA